MFRQLTVVSLLALVCAAAAFAVTNNVTSGSVFEVRDVASSTVADTNGGCFDNSSKGATGTDHTYPTPSIISATVSGTNGSTTITAPGGPWDNTVLGNCIQLTAGTNMTAGTYTITGFTDSGTLTLNAVPCSNAANCSGSTGVIGGALLTIAKAETFVVGGNIVYTKDSGTHYSISGGMTIATAGAAGTPIQWLGYHATRGDNLRATITASANSVIVFTASGNFNEFYNFDIDFSVGSRTGGRGFNISTGSVTVGNSKVTNAGGASAFGTGSSGSNATFRDDWAVNTLAAATASFSFAASGQCIGCVAQGGAAAAFVNSSTSSAVTFLRCIADSNTGATADGFQSSSTGVTMILNSIAYQNGRHGINITAGQAVLINNILDDNGKTAGAPNYGIAFTANWNVGGIPQPVDHNAFYAGAGAGQTARNNIGAGTGDVTLTADPFVAPGSHNFALNASTGGGAALKAQGAPSTFVNGTLGYLDIGAAQTQCTGTAAGCSFGGFN